MTHVRPARPQDAAAIARIHVETWRSTYAGVVPDAYLVGLDARRRANWWRQALGQRGQGERVLVAADPDHGVYGFASHGPSRTRDLPRDAPWDGEVYTLYVLPDFHGQGAGRALLTAAFAGMARDRRRGAVIWVLAANPTRFFYERMGGRRAAERVETFAGAELEEIAYVWDTLPTE